MEVLSNNIFLAIVKTDEKLLISYILSFINNFLGYYTSYIIVISAISVEFIKTNTIYKDLFLNSINIGFSFFTFLKCCLYLKIYLLRNDQNKRFIYRLRDIVFIRNRIICK